MSERPYWSVTVSVDGDPVLTIEPNMLSGHPDIERYGDQVRAAGENLLAFIGDGSIPPCFICGATEGVEPASDCPICSPDGGKAVHGQVVQPIRDEPSSSEAKATGSPQ